MSESTWPAQPQPILGTATNSAPSITQTEPSSPVDRCQLQKDSLRGILMQLKADLKTLQDRQDALHRCMTGRGLTDTSPIGDGYKFATDMLSGVAKMKWGLDQIAFTAGIKIE